MTLALDFNDEPESHDGEWPYYVSIGGKQYCPLCYSWLPIDELDPIYGRDGIDEWVCKDEVACKQRQAERTQDAD